MHNAKVIPDSRTPPHKPPDPSDTLEPPPPPPPKFVRPVIRVPRDDSDTFVWGVWQIAKVFSAGVHVARGATCDMHADNNARRVEEPIFLCCFSLSPADV